MTRDSVFWFKNVANTCWVRYKLFEHRDSTTLLRICPPFRRGLESFLQTPFDHLSITFWVKILIAYEISPWLCQNEICMRVISDSKVYSLFWKTMIICGGLNIKLTVSMTAHLFKFISQDSHKNSHYQGKIYSQKYRKTLHFETWVTLSPKILVHIDQAT